MTLQEKKQYLKSNIEKGIADGYCLIGLLEFDSDFDYHYAPTDIMGSADYLWMKNEVELDKLTTTTRWAVGTNPEIGQRFVTPRFVPLSEILQSLISGNSESKGVRLQGMSNWIRDEDKRNFRGLEIL